MQEQIADRAGSAASDTDARVVLCSWCVERGQPRVALRPYRVQEPDWNQGWMTGIVSPTFARVATLARLASHGICPDCLAWQLREINATVPEVPAGA